MSLKAAVAIIILILALAVGFGLSKVTGNTTKMVGDSNKVNIETNYGTITVELYPDKAPITVKNFKTYVNESFYDNTLFQRVIKGFMIQGGGYNLYGEEKPTNAPIKLESNNGLSNTKGTIAMARTDVEDSATSQFFINAVDNKFLDYGYRDAGYAVFGKVTKDMSVVEKISNIQTDANNKPISDVIIKRIYFVK